MISKRLTKIISHINGKVVADIGTDHGFVPVFLLENKIVDKAIATDISEPSLKKAYELAKEKNLNLDTRLGNGMEVLKREDKIDTVVIAGMGGVLISEIIKNSEISKNVRLIMQPMQGSNELRLFLFENGFEIIDEDVVFEDGRFFEILVSEYNGEIINHMRFEEDIPFIALKKNEEDAFSYILHLIEKNESIMGELKSGKRALTRYIELKSKNNFYEEIYDRYKKNN